MKQITKLLLGAAAMLAFVACEKTEDLPFYKTGNAVTLSSSSSAVAAAPSDSDKTVITYSWNSPNYATDTSTVKYIVEIDSSGRNFAQSVKKTVSGTMSAGFTGKEINAILIGYGFKIGTAYDMDVRVTSSYGNNNDQYMSNVLKMKMTPYKIPPKIPVPAELVIVGEATASAKWDNPPTDPQEAIAQRFSLLDETTYVGVFYLNGGSEYLILPKSGNWDKKFGVQDNSVDAQRLSGDLIPEGQNFKSPNQSGWYRFIIDFQTGKYTITATSNPVPVRLYTIGDATAAVPEWDNNAVGSQALTRINSIKYEAIMPLKGGKNLKFISVIGQWQPQFGKGANEGDLGANYGGGSDPGTIVPATDGNYKIEVDFMTFKYKLTKQ
jgi:hypothetical protein